jgi:hypothetical protein
MKQNHLVLKPFLVLALSVGVFALASSQARAADTEQEHPCSEYVKHCRAQELTPGHGLWKCVAHEAKKANNEVCMAKLKEGAKKMKQHKMHPEGAEKAAE